MNSPSDNRAVTALFRAFGGAGGRVVAEARATTQCRGMHAGETVFLAVLVPLTVLVALSEGLGHVLGWAGILLAFPLAFLALNLMAFALGGRTQEAQWRTWLTVFVIWSFFRRDGGMLVGTFAWIWFAVFGLNLAAWFLLGVKASLKFGVMWRLFLLVFVHGVALGIGVKFGWPWGLLGGTAIAATLCWAVLRPNCQWLGDVVWRRDVPEILITLDDGPDPQDTPALLDLLDQHGRKAVFFMIGEKVAAYPELAREVVRRGHEIGNHTMSHPQASFWCAGPRRTRREIEECQRVIEEVTGARPKWFRAPVGHRNFFTHPVADELGLQVMAWSSRGYDAVEKDVNKALGRIQSQLTAGDIVLLHEATPIAAELLKRVLEEVKTRER
jgi:peptidoglycan/xylan/chitin deacetylase (PgdA/CDA1 family)